VAWRWGNVPVPEPYVGGLVVGIVLQFVAPWDLVPIAWLGHAIGWTLVAAGLGLVVWAVTAAGEVDVEHPDSIVVRGPYARSRNPMYVAWAGIYIGITFVVNTVWPLALLPVVLGLIHAEVRREERRLEQKFGAEYIAYRRRTRRYL
jgi:protein-S-isoprenylcysteine O-methyltransferase Ste14